MTYNSLDTADRMGPPTTVLMLVALIATSYGHPRNAREDTSNFIARGTSDIAAALLQSYIDEEKNTAFSPMGYSALMAILAEGAQGNTRKELVHALRLPAENHATRAAYKNVLENLKEKHSLNVPEFHTWFYVYRNFTIEPEFKNILSENYLTQVRNVEPVYEDIKIDPPSPEVEAMMHLDHDDKKEENKHEKEGMETEKQSSISDGKHAMHKKEEMNHENKEKMPQKEDMTEEKKDMMPEKPEEMLEKDMSDNKEKMPEKEEMDIDKDKNIPKKETEFEVTPEMIENKPDSIRDPFLEDLLNKERENEDKKDGKEKEEMKKEESIKDPNNKDDTPTNSDKDENIKTITKREVMRLRRSVKYTSQEPVAEKEYDESANKEKDNTKKDKDSFKDGILMEESLLTQAMKEAAIIDEAMKGEKHEPSKDKEMEGDSKKETTMAVSEMQPSSEMEKKPAVEMNIGMSTMDKTEKHKLSTSEKDKMKPDMKKEGMEITGRSKRITRGVLDHQEVTSGISGNSIVKKSSEEPADSLMIVFNALYFKGSWVTPFDANKRGVADVFYTSPEVKVTVPVMHTDGTFNTASIPHLDSTAIELPYQGGRYSLLVLLPNQRDGLKPLVGDLLAKYPLKNVFEQLSPKKVQVYLPCFEVETTSNPKKALKMLGINDVFSKEMANLSGISKESGLFVNDLAQFVTIKVEPTHSEINYLTGSNVDRPETRVGDEEFVVDRPFLFFVVDKKNHDLVVVAGKVTDPTYKTSPFKKVKF